MKPRLSILGTLGLLSCGSVEPDDNPTLRIDQVAIDADRAIEAAPGQGVGAHFEYQGGGRWSFFLTCDTELSGYVCDFDVVASVEPPSSIRSVSGGGLEFDDVWWRIDGGAIRLLAYTSFNEDRLSFTTEPGTPLRVDVLLDGFEFADTIAWITRGEVQTGAPSMPLEFVPSEQ